MITGSLYNVPNARRIANIAGVNPQTSRPRFGGLNGPAVMKMYIGNNWHGALGTNGFQCFGAILIRTRHPHDISPGSRGRIDLCHCGINITGQAIGHGLYRNRRVATNWHRANHNLATTASFNRSIRPIGV